jgi:hypothetical protein
MVMVKRKIFSVFITLFLLPGILVNGVMNETCLCIGPCSFGLQEEIDAIESLPFHSHHTSTNCKSCNVEDGQTLREVAYSASFVNAKFLDTILITFNLLDCYTYNNRTHNDFDCRIYSSKKVQYPPIYLQNHSLLC